MQISKMQKAHGPDPMCSGFQNTISVVVANMKKVPLPSLIIEKSYFYFFIERLMHYCPEHMSPPPCAGAFPTNIIISGSVKIVFSPISKNRSHV